MTSQIIVLPTRISQTIIDRFSHNRHRLRSLGCIVIVALGLLLLSACKGSDDTESSSSGSSTSTSTSSGGGNVAEGNPDSALDWDWRTAAQTHCDSRAEVRPIDGSFEVLRPQDSDHLHPSEHFVLRWNNGDGVNLNQNTIDKALSTLEEVWQLYINELHFPEPYADTPQKYKVSVNVSDQGYASGAGTGDRDPAMWVHYDALLHTGTLAHEFAHTLQFTTRSMRDSEYVGWLWESHANWMAHQFNPSDVQCTEALVNAPHIYYGSTRNRYCNWQFFEFIKDNSCHAFINDALWRDGIKSNDPNRYSADPFSTLANNAHWSTSQLNDIFADWALHNVHWDYRENGDTYRQNYGSYDDKNGARRYRLSHLQTTGIDGEYQIPIFWAPQRWGYNLVKLTPDNNQRSFEIDFEGLVQDSPALNSFDSQYQKQPLSVPQADSSWRWSVVVTDSRQQARYYPIQRGASGRMQVTLEDGDSDVWLMVMATPHTIKQIFWDQIYYSVYRYPWKVKLQGVKPAPWQRVESGTSGAAHSNGGGFVAFSASVSPSVFVGPNAKVLENAQIMDNSRIEDYAIVAGHAQIQNDSIIKGHALVNGSASISDSVLIEDYAMVSHGRIQDSAHLAALTRIVGANTVVGGEAYIATTMNAINGHTVNGTAQLLGDIELNTSVAKGVFYGFIDAAISNNPAYGSERTNHQPEITVEPRL